MVGTEDRYRDGKRCPRVSAGGRLRWHRSHSTEPSKERVQYQESDCLVARRGWYEVSCSLNRCPPDETVVALTVLNELHQ